MRKRACNNKLLFICGQLLIFLFLVNYLFRSSTSDLTPLRITFEEMSQHLSMDSSKLIFKQQYRYEYEQLQKYSLEQIYEEPSINETSYPKLPYFYSLWKTSPMLPRLITPDEHYLYIQLLNIFDLDILPYDDDVDISINIKYYSHISKINQLNNDSNWQFYINTPTNMKFYFKSSQPAGKYPWKWPFLGIDFYSENSTHIKSYVYIEKHFVFPLLLHPISTLWLPGPNNIEMFFKSVSKVYYSNYSINEMCFSQSYSHKYETQKYQRKAVKCSQLMNSYPFIKRIYENDFYYEHLMLDNRTTLYILKRNRKLIRN
ncbi:unnamed protein product [Adineta ricciae]|uniref:Uncharacterized protein n=1 Tax=Adineta ricciae TaxID=249248 RepID=A0A815NLT1_ADIRI|nr:unnamed protein product [Adineta ricciae]